MRVALYYAAQALPPSTLRAALGISQALAAGGIEPQVILAEPAALWDVRSHACDPAITAPWTAQWQRNWRLPLGLRRHLEREPADVVVCPGEPGDIADARLALGYSTQVAIVSWLTALEGPNAPLAQYADLHLAPSAAHADRLMALPDPPRPVAYAPRPIPELPKVGAPRQGLGLLWIGRPDEEGGLPRLLAALQALPQDVTLTVGCVGGTIVPGDLRAAAQSLPGRCILLPADGDPWASADAASLCLVTSDRPAETDAIAEAAARGVPVLAQSGATGERDIVEGDPALPLDPGEIAAALSAVRRGDLQDLSRRQTHRVREARRLAAQRLREALRYLPPQRGGDTP